MRLWTGGWRSVGNVKTESSFDDMLNESYPFRHAYLLCFTARSVGKPGRLSIFHAQKSRNLIAAFLLRGSEFLSRCLDVTALGFRHYTTPRQWDSFITQSTCIKKATKRALYRGRHISCWDQQVVLFSHNWGTHLQIKSPCEPLVSRHASFPGPDRWNCRLGGSASSGPSSPGSAPTGPSVSSKTTSASSELLDDDDDDTEGLSLSLLSCFPLSSLPLSEAAFREEGRELFLELFLELRAESGLGPSGPTEPFGDPFGDTSEPFWDLFGEPLEEPLREPSEEPLGESLGDLGESLGDLGETDGELWRDEHGELLGEESAGDTALSTLPEWASCCRSCWCCSCSDCVWLNWCCSSCSCWSRCLVSRSSCCCCSRRCSSCRPPARAFCSSSWPCSNSCSHIDI